MAITLSVIGPAASVFAIGSIALRQQGSGAFLAFLAAALISGCLAVAGPSWGRCTPLLAACTESSAGSSAAEPGSWP